MRKGLDPTSPRRIERSGTPSKRTAWPSISLASAFRRRAIEALTAARRRRKIRAAVKTSERVVRRLVASTHEVQALLPMTNLPGVGAALDECALSALGAVSQAAAARNHSLHGLAEPLLGSARTTQARLAAGSLGVGRPTERIHPALRRLRQVSSSATALHLVREMRPGENDSFRRFTCGAESSPAPSRGQRLDALRRKARSQAKYSPGRALEAVPDRRSAVSMSVSSPLLIAAQQLCCVAAGPLRAEPCRDEPGRKLHV